MSVKHLNWAWDQQVKNPTTKLILMKLADGADESNRSWYSHKTLAIKCETSISSVRRHLSYLKKLNLIRIEHRIRTEGIMKDHKLLITITLISIRLFKMNTPCYQ